MARPFSELLPTRYDPNWRPWFQRNDIWFDKVDDQSARFAGGGKTIEYRIRTSNIGPVNEPAGGAAVTAGTQAITDRSTTITADSTAVQLRRGTPNLLSADKILFTLEKYHDVDLLYGDMTDVQFDIDMVQTMQEDSMREFMHIKNRYIRDNIFNTMTGDSLLQNEAGTDRAITVATGDWGNAAHLMAIEELFERAYYKADAQQWPQEGRSVLVGSRVFGLVVKNLISKNLFTNQRDDAGRAYIDGYTEGMWGWRMEKDMDIAHGIGATDDDNHSFYFMSGRKGVVYASQLNNAQLIRSEDYRGWRFMAEQSWDAKNVIPQFQFVAQTKITA